MKRLMQKPVILSAAFLAMIATAIGAGTLAAEGLSKIPGDVNVSGDLEIADSIVLMQFLSEKLVRPLTDQGLANADINRDRIIDGGDGCMLLEVLAGLVIMDPVPEETETTTTTTTTTTETTTTETTTTETTTTEATTIETTVTETTTEETTTVTETEPPPEPTKIGYGCDKNLVCAEDEVLIADDHVLPLARPESEVLDNPLFQSDYGALTETISIRYNTCMMYFHVFAEDPAKTMIIISRDGVIVGYYTTALESSCHNLYTLTQYYDTHPEGTGKLYAVQALSSSATIQADSIEDLTDFSGFSKLCFYATNAIRAVNRAPALQWSEEIAALAVAHSRDMAANGYMDHVDTDGNTLTQRLKNAGIRWRSRAENVDCGLRDPFAAADDWFRSRKGHRDNMLEPSYKLVGIGFAYNAADHYCVYGTQDFVKPPN